MRLAIAYSTKDRVELTRQTIEPLLQHDKFDLHWVDGSATEEARLLFKQYDQYCFWPEVYGGADAAIVFKLSMLLEHENNYTHIGLVENDVLLDAGWLEPTLQLFDRGNSEGLQVGAVSARSYVDRVLMQRDGYAVMHNLGAGMVIFTRQAAQLVLANFRTHWAPHVRNTWMRLSGIDIGRFWAFRGNEQWLSSDWGYDAILASAGLASLALTPAKCTMIGQDPPLAEQGLELTHPGWRQVWPVGDAFELFVARTRNIREGHLDCNTPVMDIDPCITGERVIFPHHVPSFGGSYFDSWRLKNSQGFGPFAYRAGEGGTSLVVPCYGSVSFLVSGGTNGATVAVSDSTSGYATTRDLPPEAQSGIIAMLVPGSVTYRSIRLELAEGAVFYGYSSSEEQPWNPQVKFNHATLPPV